VGWPGVAGPAWPWHGLAQLVSVRVRVVGEREPGLGSRLPPPSHGGTVTEAESQRVQVPGHSSHDRVLRIRRRDSPRLSVRL
jgi:hypothetical protein